MASTAWRTVIPVTPWCSKENARIPGWSRQMQCRLVHAFPRGEMQTGVGTLHFVPSKNRQFLVTMCATKDDNAEPCTSKSIGSAPVVRQGPWSRKDVGFASFMVLVHGACLLAPFTFTWGAFKVFLGLYFATGMLGITLSYHRNLAHKSFKLPKWLEYTFAYFGAQAMQGHPLEWVNVHRGHHQHCETELDPHSPLVHGFWYSHIGWIFDSSQIEEKIPELSNVRDMENDPFYQFLARTYILHPLMLGVVLYATGGVPYVVWGMAVRMVWVYHITWLVNSAAHIWGSRQWNTRDLSKNNWWVALLAFGEGWHNNHHAFEYSARHGLEWWQIDMTWYLVKALQSLGVATKVRLPSKEHKLKFALQQ